MFTCKRVGCCFILVLAFALRIAALDLRPAHFDEGVNGSFIDGMRVNGFYKYDPANFHGPLHFYTLFASQQLFGRSLLALRLPTVLIGCATIGLILAYRRFLPWQTVWIAALAAAVSPAMVFYSRYAIHETWLPFCTLLATYGGFGLARREGRIGDVWALGLGLAGMVLNKETYAIHLIAALLALAALWLLVQLAPPKAGDHQRPADLFSGTAPQANVTAAANFTNRQVFAVSAACIAVVILFQSGFGMNWKGLDGLWKTFELMFAKGAATGTTSEEGHHKEFFYWLKLMLNYEWPVLLGMAATLMLALHRSVLIGVVLMVSGVLLTCAGFLWEVRGADRAEDFLKPKLMLGGTASLGAWLAFCGTGFFVADPLRSRGQRWICLYGLALFTAYSLIPYKTPWCIINMLWPFFFALGHLVDSLARQIDHRVACVPVLLLTAVSMHSSWKLNFQNPTNDGARYVYVQTSPDINKLLDPLRALVRTNPLERQMRGIVVGEAFPLIWELNDFPHITYLDRDAEAQGYDADFLLVPKHRASEFEERMSGSYYRESCLIRDGGESGWLYLSASRFARFFPGRGPEINPRPSLDHPALLDSPHP